MGGLHLAVAGMVGLLPALLPLLPGTLTLLLNPSLGADLTKVDSVLQSDGSSMSGTSSSSSCTALPAVRVWSAALSCLQLLKPDLLLQLTPLDPTTVATAAAASGGTSSASSSKGGEVTKAQLHTAVAAQSAAVAEVIAAVAEVKAAGQHNPVQDVWCRSAQLRGCFVLKEMLTWRDLGEVWPLMLKMQISSNNSPAAAGVGGVGRSDGGSGAVAGGGQMLVLQPEQWDAVLLPLAVASSRAPATAQLQITAEIAAAAGGGNGGVAAPALVAALWAAWSQQQQQQQGVGGVGLSMGWACMVDTQQLLHALPRSVVGLLERAGWEGGAELMASVLLKLLKMMQRGGGMKSWAQGKAMEEQEGVRKCLACGLVEVGRHLLLQSPGWWGTVQGDEALRVMGL